jgi:hypothetical protein
MLCPTQSLSSIVGCDRDWLFDMANRIGLDILVEEAVSWTRPGYGAQHLLKSVRYPRHVERPFCVRSPVGTQLRA